MVVACALFGCSGGDCFCCRVVGCGGVLRVWLVLFVVVFFFCVLLLFWVGVVGVWCVDVCGGIF